MPCTSPLAAWRPLGSTGRPRIGEPLREDVERLQLDCGGCRSCRIKRKREWAIRAVHETQMTPVGGAAFLTITYNDRHLPANGSLKPDDLTRFLKRFRKQTGSKIRYLAAGEYGDKGLRPHFHLAIWGHIWNDKTRWKPTKRGQQLWRSETLERAWSCPDRSCCPDTPDGRRPPIGYCYLGDLEFGSAAYVAGYVMKKMTGGAAYYAYLRLNEEDELVSVEPEYAVMSRGRRADGQGGLGFTWYQRYRKDVFPKDHVHVQVGDKLKTFPAPGYYRRLLEQEDPDLAETLKNDRKERWASRGVEDTPELREARDRTLRGEHDLYHPEADCADARVLDGLREHLEHRPNKVIWDEDTWCAFDPATGEQIAYDWSDHGSERHRHSHEGGP